MTLLLVFAALLGYVKGRYLYYCTLQVVVSIPGLPMKEAIEKSDGATHPGYYANEALTNV